MKLSQLLENYSYPSLEEFITSSLRNSWITFKSSKGYTIESYVRKGPRHLNGVTYNNVLDRANTKIVDEKVILKMMDENKFMAGTGAYKEFDKFMSEIAKKHNFDAIFVEQVLNPQLLTVLERWGYSRIGNTPSFFKIISQASSPPDTNPTLPSG